MVVLAFFFCGVDLALHIFEQTPVSACGACSMVALAYFGNPVMMSFSVVSTINFDPIGSMWQKS